VNIDWRRLCEQYGVEYVEGGKSTAKGNIYVACPWCKEADQGHHLGINLAGKGWGCWKSDKHRGKNPVRLMAALFNMSYMSAQQLLDGNSPSVSDGNVGERLKAMFNGPVQETPQPKPLNMPAEIKPLTDRPGLSRDPFLRYLVERGYAAGELSQVLDRYRLHYAINGPFAYRLVFPVCNSKGKLLTFTGRSVRSNAEPRYLSVSTEKAISIKNCLWREDVMFKAAPQRKDALIVCEGPFDAMRMDWCGRNLNIHATCLFGKTVSDRQENTLGELLRFYRKIFVVLDPDAVLDNLSLSDRLMGLGARIVRIDPKYDDPAEMSAKAVEEFVKRIMR
jgi:hypothetical protein